MEANELRSALEGFVGTERYYKHFTGLLFTDGVYFLAKNAGAFWLIDVVASYQLQVLKEPGLRDFQLWTLKIGKVNGMKNAVVTCERDTDDVVLSQEIPYTDFPLDEIRLYVENGVLLLPSEH
jgi:hypothetical protein